MAKKKRIIWLLLLLVFISALGLGLKWYSWRSADIEVSKAKEMEYMPHPNLDSLTEVSSELPNDTLNLTDSAYLKQQEDLQKKQSELLKLMRKL